MKRVLCIIMAFLVVISFTACFGSYSNASLSYEFVGKLDMSVDYNSYTGYNVKIKGKLKNTSNEKFSYVNVTFAIYDKSGNQIKTAFDSTSDLQAGRTWAFEATTIGFIKVEPKSCELVNITIF